MLTSRPGVAPRRGFTLVELLVVISIVVLVSAVALPTVLPALNNRQVGEGARLVQAVLAGARDSAIRYNAPRGIRLIPDPYLGNPGNPNKAQAASRIIMIEPAPDLSDGLATFVVPTAVKAGLTPVTPAWTNAGGNPPLYPFPDPLNLYGGKLSALWSQYPYQLFYPTPTSSPVQTVLIVEEAVFTSPAAGVAVPNARTNWFWNVRIGDKFRFNDSGQYYTIIGPMTVPNPEFYVNDGAPGTTPTLVDTLLDSTGASMGVFHPQYLFLVNGVDDVPDGQVDPGFDGLDNNLTSTPPITTPTWLATPDDITEWAMETEQWVGAQNGQFTTAVQSGVVPSGKPYVITRRPVPVSGAREVSLPGATVIDLTSFGGFRERSRLPVDPLSGTVDILLNQAGQVVPVTLYSSPSSANMATSFYHFWICDRTDVHDPINDTTNNPSGLPPFLPMPATTTDSVGTASYPPATNPGLANIALKKERQLVTLFAKTGAVVTNTVENFVLDDINAPYYDAQRGVRESK